MLQSSCLSRTGLTALAFLLVALASVSPRAARGQSCSLSGDLPEPREPWVEIRPDPRADPRSPGYALFVEFRVRETGEAGRAIFVRMAGAEGKLLSRREMRRSVVVARLDTGSHLIQYSYLDPTRSGDLWVYDPKTRRMERSSTRDVEYGEPVYEVCGALEAAHPGRHIEVSAAVVGYVTPGPELRRLISVTRGCT